MATAVLERDPSRPRPRGRRRPLAVVAAVVVVGVVVAVTALVVSRGEKGPPPVEPLPPRPVRRPRPRPARRLHRLRYEAHHYWEVTNTGDDAAGYEAEWRAAAELQATGTGEGPSEEGG